MALKSVSSSNKISEIHISGTIVNNINYITTAIKNIDTILNDSSLKLPADRVSAMQANKNTLSEQLASLGRRTGLPTHGHGASQRKLSDIYHAQKNKLETLLKELANDPHSQTAKDAFGDLPRNVKTKIYEYMWIAHGVPIQDDYAEFILKKEGLGLLLQIKEPFIAEDSGNLIEQMIDVLEGKLTVAGYQDWRDCLHALLSLDKADKGAVDKMLEQLLNIDKREIEEAPEEERTKLIEQKRNHYSNLVKECFVNEAHAEINCFRALLNSPNITHRQLKVLYRKLSAAAQEKVPKSPYYGHGVKTDLYTRYGALLTDKGVTFSLFAPNAKSVAVSIRDGIDPRKESNQRQMNKTKDGNWELFWDGVVEGTLYEYAIETSHGKTIVKTDPFATESRLVQDKDRPVYPLYDFKPKDSSDNIEIQSLRSDTRGLSVVSKVSAKWNDGEWMEKRKTFDVHSSPMNIYEIYPAGWKHIKNYRDLAKPLAEYCKEMGYTHVECMALMEYQSETSWGYHPTGFFAANSRLGNLADLQYLIDFLHQNNIGVVLDWIPGHFSPASYGLGQFDGEPIYEHPTPRKGRRDEWKSFVFNYESKYVKDFLTSSAFFWIDKMHIDCFRIDAVESMINLNFARNDQKDWIANRKGGQWDLDAILFLRELNTLVHENFPGVVMMAEDSSSFRATTVPATVKGERGKKGLDFDLRWAMGWSTDTLPRTLTATEWFPKVERSKNFRGERLGALMHAADGADEPNKVMALSHDEVAQGKYALPKKMPGDKWQQFANVRLLLSYQMCLPGKKLNFMGNETGQTDEWSNRLLGNITKGMKQDLVDWEARDKDPMQMGVSKAARAMNHLYLQTPALWSHKGKIQWIHMNDSLSGNDKPRNAILGYHRTDGKGKQIVCIHNFTPNYYSEYVIHLEKSDASCDLAKLTSMKEIYNSDHADFCGSGKTNARVEILKDASGRPYAFKFQMAPLATMVFEENFS